MSHVSTLTLHRLRYGELDGSEVRSVRGHIDACDACRARLQAQEAHRAAFVAAPVPDAIRALRPKARRPWWQLAGLPALAVAAAALLFVALPDGGDGVRLKGGGGDVEVLVQSGGAGDAHVWASGEALRAGDRVQVRVPPGPWSHAWLSDGRELIADFEVSRGRATLAPFSLELDGAPGDERLVLILSEDPLGEAAARAALTGPPPSGVTVQRLTLTKSR